MKIRIGGKSLGRKDDCCSVGTCQKSLEKQPIYEWNWFVQDGESSFDGEEHHVKLCRECYDNMEKMFVHHVKSSNEIDSFVAYGGDFEELDEREKERLSKEYSNHLQNQNKENII